MIADNPAKKMFLYTDYVGECEDRIAKVFRIFLRSPQ